MAHDQNASDGTSATLHDVNQRLECLMERLAKANKACAEAARPLAKLDDMDSAQRAASAGQIRATDREWEEVTRLINELLAQANGMAAESPDSKGGG
jgi:hypothetical protein